MRPVLSVPVCTIVAVIEDKCILRWNQEQKILGTRMKKKHMALCHRNTVNIIRRNLKMLLESVFLYGTV